MFYNVHLNDQSSIIRFSARSSSPKLQLLTFQIYLCIALFTIPRTFWSIRLWILNIDSIIVSQKIWLNTCFLKITYFASEISISKWKLFTLNIFIAIILKKNKHVLCLQIYQCCVHIPYLIIQYTFKWSIYSKITRFFCLFESTYTSVNKNYK